MEKIRPLILTLAFLMAAFSSLRGATTITDSTGGIVVFRKKGFDNLDKPIVFRHIQQDQAYFDVITPDNLLIHIENDLVVKVVFFLDPATFPTKFEPEDLAVLKAKIDELHAIGSLSPDAAKLAAPQIQYLQNVYDTESDRYKQTAALAAQKFASDKEKAAFDKKCDLLRLDLQSSATDLAHSEQIVKEMEPLAPRSEMLTGVLATWNKEKNRALQISAECSDLWAAAQKTYPKSFKPAADLKDIPDFPPDMKEKIADLQNQLDQCRSSATLPQTLLYCKNEIPALFLLNTLPAVVEKIKAIQFREAGELAQKALQQVRPDQFVDPYKGVYDTFKRCDDLIEDIRTRFARQLAKAQAAETTLTNRETLAEYQKAYAIIPDPAVAAKIDQYKEKIKNQ